MKTRARRTPPTESYHNIVIFPQQETLPLGTPCFGLVSTREMKPFVPDKSTFETMSRWDVFCMHQFIPRQGLLDWIVVDENDAIIGGFEKLKRRKPQIVQVKRIVELSAEGKLAFSIAYHALLDERKKNKNKTPLKGE